MAKAIKTFCDAVAKDVRGVIFSRVEVRPALDYDNPELHRPLWDGKNIAVFFWEDRTYPNANSRMRAKADITFTMPVDLFTSEVEEIAFEIRRKIESIKSESR